MGADFEHAVDTIRKRLSAKPVAIQFPIGQEDKFKGVVDLINMKAIVWVDDTMGAEYVTEEIPAELKKKAEAFHAQLVESIARTTTKSCTSFWKAKRLRPTSCAHRCEVDDCIESIPGGVGTAFKNKGIQPLLMRWWIICLPARRAGNAWDQSDNGQSVVARRTTRSRSRRWRSDHGGSVRRAIDIYPRIFRAAEDWRFGAERPHHQD